MGMEDVSKQLRMAYKENVDMKWYVPRPAIEVTVNKEAILKIVLENNLPADEENRIYAVALQPRLVEDIHLQAKATFAILIHLGTRYLRYITSLILYGKSQGSEIDRHLPLTRNVLLGCRLDTDHANAFCSAQWHFIAPKIRFGAVDPIDFELGIILPFRFKQVERFYPEAGAFGSVTEISVEPGHQEEPGYNGRIVRKQFHPDAKKSTFFKELRNLSILSSARHENIVQLLLAYVHNESFNLLFPLASHGNLHQLFQTDTNSSRTIMESDDSLVMALCGLASALVTMHEFTSESLNIIGCHRDLKPANILVHGQQLLLADFGLSRVVDSQDTSSSIAPNNPEDFIAPEHEGKDFARNPIGRSSDIWSFGCVILMLLVYYRDGCIGLKHLESIRRREWPQYTHHCFHDYDKPNPGVEKLFWQLALSTSTFARGLLFLIKKMLILEKDMRPKAAAVDTHIRSLAIHMRSISIEEGFDKACESDFTHVYVERARFQGWRSAVKITNADFPQFSEAFAGRAYSDFKAVMDHLQELKTLLAGFSRSNLHQGRKAFLPVRSRIDRLLEGLDSERHTSATAYTDYVLLRRNKSSVWLRELQTFSEKNLDRRIEGKIITRRQILNPARAKPLSGADLCVNFSALKPLPRIDNVSKVQIFSRAGPEPDVVIAEEKRVSSSYALRSAPRHYPQSTPARLQEAANLLSASADKGLFKVLRCRGYYHHTPGLGSGQQRSGLLYELPSGPRGKLEQIKTLRKMIESGSAEWLLGDRFRLAHELATALFELHSVSWLHRNLSASNIAFFYREQEDAIDPKSFYFIGFAQSRPDRDFTDSDGPTSGVHDDEYYQHPEYSSQDQGYHVHHDYYSFGMLLLEIGLWQLYPDAVRSMPSGQVRTIAMKELVPRLGSLMGRSYRDAVLACLDGTLSAKPSAAGVQEIPMLFRASVVDQLSPNHCRA